METLQAANPPTPDSVWAMLMESETPGKAGGLPFQIMWMTYR